MKTQRSKRNEDGVALIMVLGLLAVMTVLSVAFSIAMRVERLAARNYAHAVRAEQLIMTAQTRAVADINAGMVGQVYPDWRQRNQNNGEGLLPTGFPVYDAMCSDAGGGDAAPDLLTGEALRTIPHSLLDHAKAMTPEWIDDGITNGRVSWVVVNVSGLLDANYVGGATRLWSKHPSEIDIGNLPEITNAPDFYADRGIDLRYETVPELAELNTGVTPPVSNLFVFSFDVAKDQFFEDAANPPTNVDTNRPPQGLGLRTAVLHDKFYVNSITNYKAYYNPGVYTAYKDSQNLYGEDFIGEYWQHMRDMLEVAGLERPDDVSWNLINYLDPDRVPQGAEDYPWRHTEGGEAIPLINEIVLQEIEMGGHTTNVFVNVSVRDPRYPGYWTNMVVSGGPGYSFAVELWYPFAPVDVEPKDGFMLQVGVFNTQHTDKPELDIMRWAATNWSFTAPIANMEFGTATEFVVITSPASKIVTFPTNSSTAGEFAPIGSIDPNTGFRHVVYFLARVLKTETNNYGNVVATNPVDEAMGYRIGQTLEHKRLLKEFDQPQGYSVNDPRSNGQVKYWWNPGDATANPYIGGPDTYAANIDGFNYPPDQHTLGTTNANCDPWSFKGHGVPIYAKNGPMINVGELGHIFRSNLDDEANTDYWYWRNINLMRSDEGAMLLDLMTVDPKVVAKRGLFCINSWQRDAMIALFNNLEIGVSNVVGAARFKIPQQSIDDLVDTIIAERDRRNRPFLSYADLFTDEDSDEGGGGPVADAFRECAPQGPDSNDIYKEDTFRHICELISFRNNIYLIFMIAQATQDLPNGDKSVLAERRAVATVYRDSYTGRHFTRSFKWLTD